jgi:hypothetical protein
MLQYNSIFSKFKDPILDFIEDKKKTTLGSH